MYYILYLASLCRRRRWQEPSYEAYATTDGYTCIVRVNNREYQTDAVCASETLARESAAMRAYLICRNFSVNDGMYPAGHDHGGVVQGIPVAIGTGRKASRDDDTDTSVSSSSGGSWSGGSSPERMMGFDHLGGQGRGLGHGHGHLHMRPPGQGRGGSRDLGRVVGSVGVSVPAPAMALGYTRHEA